jgi:ketosteroid isomerase-like protein
MDHSAAVRDAVRQGLSAWGRDDVSGLADVLHPDVELLWWTPGDWDCHGKDQVVALLRERLETEPAAEVDITELADDAILVERRHVVQDGPEAVFRPATVVRFKDGLVVRMRQYRSRADALADSR